MKGYRIRYGNVATPFRVEDDGSLTDISYTEEGEKILVAAIARTIRQRLKDGQQPAQVMEDFLDVVLEKNFSIKILEEARDFATRVILHGDVFDE